MVANLDLRSGFETYLNRDFTKNSDPDLIRISDFRSGLKPDFGFQIRIEIRISDSDPDLIWISDYRSDFDKKII